MMLGVLRTNRTNVLAAAARLRASLAQLESALEQDDPQALDALLGRARDRYTEMIP
jgi:prephenate dehydrogenase